MKISVAAQYVPFLEMEPGVRLFVDDSGEGPKGTLLFIAGWPMSAKVFEYQFQKFVPAGYRCIGVDLRGFGHSDKPWGEYSYDVFVADIDRVIDRLAVDNITLVGHSMGGAIAMRCATGEKRSRIGKLVLVGAAAPSFTQRTDFPVGVERSVVDQMISDCLSDRAKMLARFGEACFSKPVSAAYSRWLHSISMAASPYATVKGLEALRDSDLRQQMAQVRVPTLIFHGCQDKIAPLSLAEELHRGINNSQLIRFENAGHCVFYEELQEFNHQLMEFVGN
jgi:pimeloyl-ACP methyl ester carboxylesterase